MGRMMLKVALTGTLYGFLALQASVWAAEGGGSDGQPLGQAVAAKEQAYAKVVTLPEFSLSGTTITQDRSRTVPDGFKDPAARMCKPFCVQSESIPGATTIKLEDFPELAADINAGKMLVVDMRTPDWYEKGTIPGAVNIVYSDLTGAEAKAKARMNRLDGKDIIAFCNGWWCGQTNAGIPALVRLGYPGKIYWFRGGAQDWADAGLTLVKP